MRVAESRMGMLTTLEDGTKLVNTWRSALPNANSVGKLSLAFGASWLLSRGVSYYVGKRTAGVNPIAAASAPSSSIMRYLALQGLTLVVLPFIRNKISENSSSDFLKSMAKPNLDQIFYRWLGLES